MLLAAADSSDPDHTSCRELLETHSGPLGDDQTREQTIRNHGYTMAGQAAPAHAPVGAPLITLITPNREIEWRGTAGAANYSVEESTSGASGPWTAICNLCATDTRPARPGNGRIRFPSKEQRSGIASRQPTSMVSRGRGPLLMSWLRADTNNPPGCQLIMAPQ